MQIIKHTECPLCLSGNFNLYIEIKDYSVSKEVFPVNVCKNCGLLFTDEIPSEQYIGKYYRSDTYVSHTNKGNTIVNRIYKLARNYTLKKKINLLDKYPGKSLLDVGCGTGMFLQKSLKAGYEIKGIETDPIARANLPKLIDNQVVNSISAVGQNEKFHKITLWHVLEHIHNLREEFQKLVSLLLPLGHLIIAVPNPDSWDACHYGKKWAAWDVPRHLYHFKKQQIEYLFAENNISLVETVPMKLDSYYVSMLSEKYKGNSTMLQLIKGVLFGTWSNLRSKKNNYSSIIYIGRKNEE